MICQERKLLSAGFICGEHILNQPKEHIIIIIRWLSASEMKEVYEYNLLKLL